MSGFADILDDGRLVVSTIGVPEIIFGTAPAIKLPTYLMFTRATMVDNRAYAVGKGNGDGNAYLVSETGRIANLGMTAGNQCVAISPSIDHLVVAMQTTPTSVQLIWLEPVTFTIVSIQTRTIPQTSQGLSDVFSDGSFSLIDPVFRKVCNRLVGYLCQRANYTIAQDNETGNPVISDNVTIGTLAIGSCYEPHFSTNRLHWCCRSDILIMSGVTPSVIPPLVPSPQPPTPLPPQPTPIPTPIPVPPVPPVLPSSKPIHMMNVYATLNGKFIGVDPAVPTVVYDDRTSGGGWELITLVPNDKQFYAKFGASNVYLSVDQYGKLSTRNDPAKLGTDESFYATNQPEGTSILYRYQNGDRVVPTAFILTAAK